MNQKWAKETIWRVIRKKCIDCGDGTNSSVEKCPIRTCSLWEYRFGIPLDKWKARKKARQKKK